MGQKSQPGHAEYSITELNHEHTSLYQVQVDLDGLVGGFYVTSGDVNADSPPREQLKWFFDNVLDDDVDVTHIDEIEADEVVNY